jgi:hypothetical protein
VAHVRVHEKQGMLTPSICMARLRGEGALRM